MGKKNPIEDANLLYVIFIIIVVLIITVLVVEVISNRENTLQSEKILSNIKIEPLSSNSFEISLKVTNNGFSTVEMEDFSFYWENEKMNPKSFSKSCLRKGEHSVIKIGSRVGELKILYGDKLVYSHYFP